MVEEKNHECKCNIYCVDNVKLYGDGFFVVKNCSKFNGDLSNMVGLKVLYLANLKITNLKFPCYPLQTVCLEYMCNLKEVTFPIGLQELFICNCPLIRKIECPNGLYKLELSHAYHPSLEVKFPIGFQKEFVFFHWGLLSEENLLIDNGYYDEEYLSNCWDYNDQMGLGNIKMNNNIYKRRCVNLNWLFKDNNLWDWHLNLIIDEYMSKKNWTMMDDYKFII